MSRQNHLLGISIYAAVTAHLRRKLLYPGDLAGWDREHCQSSGLLNGYFEEWVVLNEAAGDEAFNIQDGLPFTWGRFWPELAGWYGVEWVSFPLSTDDACWQRRNELKFDWDMMLMASRNRQN